MRIGNSEFHLGQALSLDEFRVARCLKNAMDQPEIMTRLGFTELKTRMLTRRLRVKTGATTNAQLVYWLNCELFWAGLLVKGEK